MGDDLKGLRGTRTRIPWEKENGKVLEQSAGLATSRSKCFCGQLVWNSQTDSQGKERVPQGQYGKISQEGGQEQEEFPQPTTEAHPRGEEGQAHTYSTSGTPPPPSRIPVPRQVKLSFEFKK